MQCINCDVDTTNPKFCTKSCAAIYNNQKSPKRKLEGTCGRCNKPCTRQRTYCRPCWDSLCEERSIQRWENATLGEMKGLGNANAGGRYPYIREMSRKKYIASGQPLRCKECDYSLHVDICHIKEIKSFPLTTEVSEVNNINNLVALCKNHHWELDNGYLNLLGKAHRIPRSSSD